MKKAVLALGIIALSAPLANACEYQRSAQAKLDKTVVASVSEPAINMSTPTRNAEEQAIQPQDADPNRVYAPK